MLVVVVVVAAALLVGVSCWLCLLLLLCLVRASSALAPSVSSFLMNVLKRFLCVFCKCDLNLYKTTKYKNKY